ncbi:hypothetical protein AB0873_14860 [Micromonospora sp. NPDC047707]|uniref:hypothetical protein n=1 Tax=Micromonospora sp. NPDC047707 TaxID=3154498 RepID=UPI003455A92F
MTDPTPVPVDPARVKRLTDDEMRAAAATRPGFATYATFRPDRPIVLPPRQVLRWGWWRPCWQWRVRTVAGDRVSGYAYTKAGARRRAARAVRRWSR